MTSLKEIDSKILENLVGAVNKAVTDDIKQDVNELRLSQHNMNSYPSRIWDLINRNIIETFSKNLFVITNFTKRGPWNLLPIFDKESGVLFTIMREERFSTIKKDPQRLKHYVGELARVLNVDMDEYQQTLFETNPINNKMQSSIQKIIQDLSLTREMVKNHALILFTARDGLLISIRCCIINSLFEECQTMSLNDFIKVCESVVVDKVSEPESKFNDPTHGLSLTNKAKKRKGLQPNLSEKTHDDEAKAE